MRLILLSIFISLSLQPVQAALVDNGVFNSDSETGLDWLDLSFTTNLLPDDAATANPGWRVATYTEIENLFWTAFDGYYDTDPAGWSDTLDGPTYADQAVDVQNFLNIFGSTYVDFGGGDYQYLAMGNYLNEFGANRVMGAIESPDSQSTVLGLNFNLGATSNGSFLVRETVIPVPAGLWLFASGLFSLGWVKQPHKAS
jgi:hypothetical protein